MNNNTLLTTQKSRFQFAEHPWISLVIIVLLTLFLMILAGILGLSGVNFLFYHGLRYFSHFGDRL